MDITKLPFDAEVMLAGLKPWVEIESPTFDAARVNAMLDHVARECAVSGAIVERIAGRMGFDGGDFKFQGLGSRLAERQARDQ